MSEFKIGDRVEVVDCYSYDEVKGMIGTVIFIRKDNFIYVNWDFKTSYTYKKNVKGIWYENVYGFYSDQLMPVFSKFSKEEKLLRKINSLYNKCKTTQHWVIKNV